jgi:DNA-binding transcriptional ArsR family regulator
MSPVDRDRSEPQLSVDWVPAYELVISLIAFASAKMHPNLDLGASWLRQVRERLPASFRAGDLADFVKEDHGLVMLLVLRCPGDRAAETFVDWLAELTPGAAYDVLCELMPEDKKLPRDFYPWRDQLASVFRTWNECFFSAVDPSILDSLHAEANLRRKRLNAGSAADVVEEITNGLWWEPAPELRRIVLAPQYHSRPYNCDESLHDGVVIFYPADVVPLPADAPPTGLLRLTRGLGDESRLRILRFLTGGPCTLTEVARFAGLSQPTVHHHLTQLRAAGLVRVHCSVKSPNRYSLRPGAVGDLAQQLTGYLEPGKGGSNT